MPDFQTATDAMDAAIARVLSLSREDMRCLDRLREGPKPLPLLAHELALSKRAFADLITQLEIAGYVHHVAGEGGQGVAMTPHALAWIESLYGPLRDEGVLFLTAFSTRDLETIGRFLTQARLVQERHTVRLRALELPSSSRGLKPRPRGALSPAARRRVEIFVEANLARAIPLGDLAARAGLSSFHFARAFKIATGTTPHAYVVERRVAQVTRLLQETDLSLVQIALACGFSTQSRMTTAFRKARGSTPARFRAASRGPRPA